MRSEKDIKAEWLVATVEKWLPTRIKFNSIADYEELKQSLIIKLWKSWASNKDSSRGKQLMDDVYCGRAADPTEMIKYIRGAFRNECFSANRTRPKAS